MKTLLEQCKDEVAIRHGYDDWYDSYTEHIGYTEREKLINEAMTLYAKKMCDELISKISKTDTEEFWIEIPEYENSYLVSNKGRVKSLLRVIDKGVAKNVIQEERIIKQRVNHRGYPTVILCKNGLRKSFLVHRLVAISYLSNPYMKPQVNHIDGNPMNSYLSNLEWVTGSENIQHASMMGKMNKGRDIIDVETLEEWDSLKKACLDKGYNYDKARKQICGMINNDTTLRYKIDTPYPKELSE